MRLDASRLAVLRHAMILDSLPERAYDDITRLLSTTLEVPIAIVNLLDVERDWFKSCVGLQQSQSPAVTSFCEAFFGTNRDLIVVEDMLLDDQFKAHPLVAGPPFIRFYAAARLIVRGETVGTLCAYDARPRQLSTDQLDQLRTMASAAIELIEKRGESAQTVAG
jgi:GAF domain-containing protein